MYIKYQSTNYPCRCRPGKIMRYTGLPDDFPAPVSGEIVLYDNDGFLMRADIAEDYLRQTFENGVLTLTNEPEPEPMPEPEPTEPAPTLEDLQAENKTLRAQVNLLQEQQTFLEDCLLEMADEVYA